MKYKIKILKILFRIIQGTNKLPYNNLEKILNYNTNSEPLWGYELINCLKEMESEKLIKSDETNWYYSITEEGLNYLNKYQKNKD